MPGIFDKPQQGRHWIFAFAALLLLTVGTCWTASSAGATPIPTRFSYAPGEIVPLPAAVPHEEGDMVDRRIVPDLRWIDAHFPIYISDGYSGPLPGSGRHVGCDGCHTKGSDHHYGMAVDIVPTSFSSSCDASWRPITRLARWAEPRQNRPVHPFRWVGYDGDAGHGCGNHLHLSWNHDDRYKRNKPSRWVEIFKVHRKSQKRAVHSSAAAQTEPPAGALRHFESEAR